MIKEFKNFNKQLNIAIEININTNYENLRFWNKDKSKWEVEKLKEIEEEAKFLTILLRFKRTITSQKELDTFLSICLHSRELNVYNYLKQSFNDFESFKD